MMDMSQGATTPLPSARHDCQDNANKLKDGLYTTTVTTIKTNLGSRTLETSSLAESPTNQSLQSMQCMNISMNHIMNHSLTLSDLKFLKYLHELHLQLWPVSLIVLFCIFCFFLLFPRA